MCETRDWLEYMAKRTYLSLLQVVGLSSIAVNQLNLRIDLWIGWHDPVLPLPSFRICTELMRVQS